ncbi:MAG: hypothetical protein IPN59_06810 [Holophaga sp.]|nr:hypothetical protein [Holophaga sp.]
MPVFSCFDKGDVFNPKRGTTYDENRISFDVSDKDWDDFPGQVEDAIAFLSKWESELTELNTKFSPEEMILDFPLYSRLDGNIINQNDYLPKELITLAGRLGLCIGMSIYDKDHVDDL